MKLTNKCDISIWAFKQCFNGNDTEEIRDLITSDWWMAFYCIDIKIRKNMIDKIRRQDVKEYVMDKINENNRQT